MAPAFASTKQAAAFTALLGVLLLLPVVVGKSLLPPREEIYSALTWRYCATEFIHQQLFREKSDIDIAFIGSSRMWAGIDTPYVQRELSKKLGREAVVRTIAWSWLGFDADYFIARDLLQNRKVKMIVFDDEFRGDNMTHPAAPHWFRYGDDAREIAGMPLRIRMSYYFAAILGMPRNLLSLVRPNIPEVIPSYDDVHWAEFYHAPNSKESLGSLTAARWTYDDLPFADFTPNGDVEPPDVRIYSPATQAQFHVTGPSMTPWQLRFARDFADLAAEHHTRLVFLHLTPADSSREMGNPLIEERENWPAVLDHDLTMIGVPPARLYSGITQEDLLKLFFGRDFTHYNKNGQRFFTRVITPTLLQIYETRASR